MTVAGNTDRPLTLRAARELLTRSWPGRHAANSEWLAYHRRGAELFDEAARHDHAHHHEALYLAQCEREAAQTLADHLAAESGGT